MLALWQSLSFGVQFVLALIALFAVAGIAGLVFAACVDAFDE